MDLPYLVFSDTRGNVYSHPHLRMTISAHDGYTLPDQREIIAFPKGSSLFYMPGRKPVGFNPDTGGYEVLDDFRGEEVFTAAAFLIPGYLRLHHPAYVLQDEKILPLWAYTACGFKNGRFVAAAMRIDKRRHQEPQFYDCEKIKKAINDFKKKFLHNRLYQHLAHCALNFNCLNAKNLFLQRWEAGIPTSPRCNANCLGCISHQDGSGFEASHQRLTFVPSVEEISELMLLHLKNGVRPMVSFGQGCEGEPLLQGKIIARAAKVVRGQTTRGRIHVNTNGSLPNIVEALCHAGVDSFRFSLNSVNEPVYNAYFRPKGYRLVDVIRSISIAKKYKKFVSINLLTFPGITDRLDEVKAWIKFIQKYRVDMIQWRNLNIDDVYHLSWMPSLKSKPLGLLQALSLVHAACPKIRYGYFNKTTK
jgi:pyruvate-formate lyase-activating enzyme